MVLTTLSMEALAPPLPLLLLIMGALILLLKMEPAANNRKIGADVTRIGLSLEITAEKLADAAPPPPPPPPPQVPPAGPLVPPTPREFLSHRLCPLYQLESIGRVGWQYLQLRIRLQYPRRRSAHREAALR